jgi:hypothetical protein
LASRQVWVFVLRARAMFSAVHEANRPDLISHQGSSSLHQSSRS